MNEFTSWFSYQHFAYNVRRKSRFIRTPEDEAFLHEVVRTAKCRVRDLPQGFILWRAQLGHNRTPHYENNEYMGDFLDPYPPARMKPLPGQAAEGRANPKGIPVLYLSNLPKTAMSEVRPWLGSHISCARFETVRPLRIVDLSVLHGKRFEFWVGEPSASEREKAVWTQIDLAFSEPTTSADDSADYVPTQMIAELFKSEGYDGIVYKSAFGDKGYNIALFDIEAAKLTACNLWIADSLEFSFKESGTGPYWIDEDSNAKTVSVEAVGPVPPTNESKLKRKKPDT